MRISDLNIIQKRIGCLGYFDSFGALRFCLESYNDLGCRIKTFSPNCRERFEKTSQSGTEISINLGIALQMIVTGVLESLSISSEWQMSGC